MLVMKMILWLSTALIMASPFQTAEPTCTSLEQQNQCWCLLLSTGIDGETSASPTSVSWVRKERITTLHDSFTFYLEVYSYGIINEEIIGLVNVELFVKFKRLG